MDNATTTAGLAKPWNKGKLIGQKPPLKLKEIWAIRIRLQLDHRAFFESWAAASKRKAPSNDGAKGEQGMETYD